MDDEAWQEQLAALYARVQALVDEVDRQTVGDALDAEAAYTALREALAESDRLAMAVRALMRRVLSAQMKTDGD
jgi:hypothetical protein